MTTAPLPFPHSPSAAVGPVVPLPDGVRIDRFVIDRTLHQGPHGFAYLVREAGHTQPLVLLECFPRALAIRQPDGAVRARQAGDAIALSVVAEAFVQDARALAAVSHPGIVKVFGTINANRTVYRLMPYIEGQTLEQQRLERADTPTVGGLVRLYDKVLDALEALHAAGFVHGYVQPDQILMRRDDNAPVLLGMDGVALELGEITMSPWAAPEQQQTTRFERVSPASDLYMLATTLVFAATGAAPPRAEERLTGHPWDPAAALADVPLGGGDAPALRENFIQAVTASLSLAAAARPQRPDDVRHILRPQGNQSGFASTTGPVPLWVGEMPDRDSQWDTLEGMSNPMPLRGSTGPAPLDPASRPLPLDDEPRGPRSQPAIEPILTPLPVRPAPAATEPMPRVERRSPDASRGRPALGLIAAGGVAAALLVAVGAWYAWRAPPAVPIVQAPDTLPPPSTAAEPTRGTESRQPAATPAATAPPSARTESRPAPTPSPAAVASAPATAPAITAAAAPAPTVAAGPTVAPAASASTAPAPALPASAAAPSAMPSATAAAASAALPAAVTAAAVALSRTATPATSAAPAPAPAAAKPSAPVATPPAAPAARSTTAQTRPAASTAAAASKPVVPAKPAATSKTSTAKPATTKPAEIARKPPATAPAPARNATAAGRTQSPDSLCANRTQFAYLYCMQEQCARAVHRNNSQCAALRRSGDLR